MIIGREQAQAYFRKPKARSKLLGCYIWFFGYPDLHTPIRFRAIKKYLKRNLKTIELGAGQGGMTFAVNHFIKQPITSLIYEPTDMKLVKSLKSPYPNNFIIGDITKLTNIQEKFEQILIIDVLEHVDDVRALKQTSRIAAPDSFLIISVPTPNYPKIFGQEFADSIGHLRPGYFLPELSELLTDAGFKVVDYSYYTGLISQFFCGIIYKFFKNNRYLNWLFYPIFSLICLLDFWGNDTRAASLAVIAKRI